MDCWSSDAFFCIEDRYSTATVRCKACGTTFEADVEENRDESKWLLVRTDDGSLWSAMYLKCPTCPNHEEHAKAGTCSICGVDVEPEPKAERGEVAAMARDERRAVRRALRAGP